MENSLSNSDTALSGILRFRFMRYPECRRTRSFDGMLCGCPLLPLCDISREIVCDKTGLGIS
jgi:hypothetical protein